MPRAYWLDKPTLSSHVMLIEPSKSSFKRIEHAIVHAKQGEYDMEIMNNLFGSSCLVLPHQPYALLTGEFRHGENDHSAFLGSSAASNGKGGNGGEEWDELSVIDATKFVHFSDYPFPKPWQKATEEEVENTMPDCVVDRHGEVNCRGRNIWLGLYRDFRERRKDICGMELASNPHE